MFAKSSIARRIAHIGTAAGFVLASGAASATANIVIVNGDAAGVGFNDPTVAAPIGGNMGTTLGAQRLNAFQAAANKWGSTLTSASTIRILATFEALTCTSTSAVLGSAGATEVFRDFTGAPRANAFFSAAETGALIGADPDPATAPIRARFNVNLGKTGCLDGTFFYLGLDANHGANVDLVTVLTHEFGHGLGFQTYTNGQTGAYLDGATPSIWDYFLLDSSINLTWNQMTPAQRAASSLKSGQLVWTGAGVNAALPGVLQAGTPELAISGANSINGTYLVGTASFGPALSSPGVTATIMPVVDQADGVTGLACTTLSAANAKAVNGKIALVDRGTCNFNLKAENVQAAGAVGMIVADNAAGSPPAGLGGTDATVTIPSVRITQADGQTLKSALVTRSRTSSAVVGKLDLNLATYAGADTAGRMMMFAPNPYQSGSSVSHYDTSAFRNQLMEPAINADLTHEVTPPYDLTYKLLQDIGWR